jgi:hypothetical protein
MPCSVKNYLNIGQKLPVFLEKRPDFFRKLQNFSEKLLQVSEKPPEKNH